MFWALGVLLLLLVPASARNDTVDAPESHRLPSVHGGSKPSVCIIGAGASGLTSALRLRQKGYREITIFERNAVPGGKAVTIKVENNAGVKDAPIYIAAILGAWGSYNSMTALLQQYNVPIQNTSFNGVPPGASLNLITHVINDETGTIVPTSALPVNRTVVSAAAAKYVELYKQAKPYIVPGFSKDMPPALRQSYGAWLHSNGLESLLPFLYTVVTAYGYGSLEGNPACYALNFVDPALLSAALGLGGVFITDFQMLWDRVAADLARSGVKFVYNADISSVTRSTRSGNSIRYTTPSQHPGRPAVQNCDRIIAAFPHIKKNLAAFDLDAQERAVFDLVRQVQYYSGVINLRNSTAGRFSRLLELTGNPAAPFSLAEPPGDGLPALYFKWPYSPVGQFYTWVAGETEVPVETLAANAVAVMSKFNRPDTADVTQSVPLTRADLIRIDKWDYFAQFSMATLTDTAFQQLETLQGRRGSFFTSSLRSFESQEMVVQSATDIVNRYF